MGGERTAKTDPRKKKKELDLTGKGNSNVRARGPIDRINTVCRRSRTGCPSSFLTSLSFHPVCCLFDELEILAPRRNENFSESSSCLVNTLLTKSDCPNDRKGIYVITTTNRPDRIDLATLRLGRLDSLLFVNLLNAEGE